MFEAQVAGKWCDQWALFIWLVLPGASIENVDDQEEEDDDNSESLLGLCLNENTESERVAKKWAEGRVIFAAPLA